MTPELSQDDANQISETLQSATFLSMLQARGLSSELALAIDREISIQIKGLIMNLIRRGEISTSKDLHEYLVIKKSLIRSIFEGKGVKGDIAESIIEDLFNDEHPTLLRERFIHEVVSTMQDFPDLFSEIEKPESQDYDVIMIEFKLTIPGEQSEA